jgi:hypothetical protein
MDDYMTPFTRRVNLQDGTILDATVVQACRLSDFSDVFADIQAEAALIAENPLMYHVYEATQNPKIEGNSYILWRLFIPARWATNTS